MVRRGMALWTPGMKRLSLLAIALLAGAAAPPAPTPHPTPPAKPAPPPASHEMIYRGEATSILGRKVIGPDKKLVGRIVDILVDEDGQPRAAVIDVGGFLGVGDRRIAVAWRALTFAPDTGRGTITLAMTANQIKATPEYKPAGKPVTVAAPPKQAPAAKP